MGAKQSSTSAAAPAVSASEDLLKELDLSAPTAAVVGAGMAGVHAAYELARLGFKVTVFDRHIGIGQDDSTRFSRKTVGIGNRYPYMWRLSVWRDAPRGLLPLSVPDIYATDNAHIALLAKNVFDWAYARYVCTKKSVSYRSNQVYEASQALAAESVETIHSIASLHPQLRSYVQPLSRIAVLGDQASADQVDTKMFPASSAPILLDTERWTAALGNICSETLGVDFRCATEVTGLHPRFLGSKEYVGAVYHKSNDTSKPARQEKFDVVVMATNSDSLMMFSAFLSKVPLVSLAGFCATLPASHPAVQTVASRSTILPPKTESVLPTGVVDPTATLVDVATSSGVVMEPEPSSNGAKVSIRGMLSLDACARDVPPPKAAALWWERLTGCLRTRLNMELPSLAGETSRGVEVPATHVYTRCFSIDGAPVISRVGTVFNAFVFSGFGDQTAEFAPAGARLLASVVRDAHRNIECTSSTLDENPFSLDRIPGYAPPYAAHDEFTYFQSVQSVYEPRIVDSYLPMQKRFRQLLSDIARQDNAPMWFRNLVFANLIVDEDMQKFKEWRSLEDTVLPEHSPLPEGLKRAVITPKDERRT